MRALAFVLILIGCGAAQHPVAPPPDDATIKKQSQDLLVAMDHGDVKVVDAALDEHFIQFDGRVNDRAHVLEDIKGHATSSSQIAKRTWSDEHVSARGTDAIYVAKAVEHQGGNDVHGGYDFEGWYAFGWSRASGTWKLVYLDWQVSGSMSKVALWNQIYEHSTGFEHAPNHLLVTSVEGVTPGTALDVAMGQGRNALYLAQQGWKVTGIDIADEGLRQARDTAAKAKLTIETINADVGKYDYGIERYDLIAMIYAWPGIPRIADLQKATKPGGLFVYEFFMPDAEDKEAPAAGELAKQFAGWDILVDKVVDDVPDWAQDRAKLQRFVARKKR